MKPISFGETLVTITALAGSQPGQNRLVYTPAWVRAQTALIRWGQDAGLQATVDDFGTVYLDLIGRDPTTVIATGSHMDTVVDGGRFDGLYGVLGGFQALTTLQQRFGQPDHTLRLISFSEEEGSRFPVTFSGSKHYIHQAVDGTLTDATGTTLATAQHAAVTQLLALPNVHHARPALPQSFTELHIEQGPRLEQARRQIGLVTGLVGQRRLTITLQGVANHAGTTPMAQRHDALQAAVWLINRLRTLAATLSPDLTFTVGRLDVTPNTPNVIPGRVSFTVDFRHADNGVLTRFEDLIHQEAHQVPDATLTLAINRWVQDDPVVFDPALLATNQRLADRLGLTSQQLVSGAGHDSGIMSRVTPTAMIFVPSVAGISHAPAEFTAPADLDAGIHLLTASLQAQAYVTQEVTVR